MAEGVTAETVGVGVTSKETPESDSTFGAIRTSILMREAFTLAGVDGLQNKVFLSIKTAGTTSTESENQRHAKASVFIALKLIQ